MCATVDRNTWPYSPLCCPCACFTKNDVRTHESRWLRVVVRVLELEASLAGEHACAREQVQIAHRVDVGVRQQDVGDVGRLHAVRSEATGDGVLQQAQTRVDLQWSTQVSRNLMGRMNSNGAEKAGRASGERSFHKSQND